MTPEQITDGLKGVESWEDASSLERGSFALEMKDRQYGIDPICQAWAWFHFGWRAAISQNA